MGEGGWEGAHFLKVSLKAATNRGTSLLSMALFNFAHLSTADMTGCADADPPILALIDVHIAITLEKT